MTEERSTCETSPWPHRVAVALACATFPLLWVGGLVTTTDAGMAVPDWPSTYGYNLFLYPWQTWIAGPWDIFVEHGHRLLAAAVGMITIGLLAVLCRADDRVWMRWLGLVALALVILQGVLGGMRVLLDERTLAMLHGCTGPLFFAVAAAVAIFTSRRWRDGRGFAPFQKGTKGGALLGATGSATETPALSRIHIRRLAIVTCILVYLQIVLGAVLRHVPIDSEPTTFALAVRFHLFLAGILSLHIIAVVWSVLRIARRVRPLGGLAWTLLALLLVQLALGAGTWVVKFAAPTWAPQWVSLGRTAVAEGGWLQTHIITAHVAVGSLLLITALSLALHSTRLLATPRSIRSMAIRKMEAAV